MAEQIDIPTGPEVEPEGRNNTVIIIAVVVLVLLCCCCGSLAALWFLGDPIIEAFEGFAFQSLHWLV
jgi:hypothetical protein